MELLEIPEEVIEGMLLKYLSWNDLLRFRRVCHTTKQITDGYLQVHPKRAPEIEINEKTGKTFEAFLDMGIPTTKLFLSNPFGYHFYEDMDSSRGEFIAEYAPLINHLRVTQLTIWPIGKELEFLNSLVNLQTFEASHFGWSRKINSSRKAPDQLAKRCAMDWRLYEDAFSQSFKNLESIIIGENLENDAINRLKVTAGIFMHSQKLKRASLPITWTNSLVPPTYFQNGTLTGEMNFLKLYMEPRPNDVYSELGRLEVYDFVCCHDKIGGWDEWKTREIIPVHWVGSLDFLELLEIALQTGLKFANVSPFWFYGRDAKNGRHGRSELGIPVVSLRGLHPSMMTLDLPNLEKITIPHTSRSVGIAEGEGRPEWPALKSLDLNVDHFLGFAWTFKGVQELGPFTLRETLSIDGLWRLLFQDVVRGNLTELELKFEEEWKWKEDQRCVVPKMEDIVGACPNLKRIHLGNWLGKNSQLLKLWEGLPGLEEVTLEGCRKVGNVTFVGEEKANPVFFKLKNLKKLTLKRLDKMPKITDLLFEMVLAKFSLKELVITSDKPLDKVTKEGISALLEGPFAETIEKFPFENWSMAGVSTEQFQVLVMKFRSYNMI